MNFANSPPSSMAMSKFCNVKSSIGSLEISSVRGSYLRAKIQLYFESTLLDLDVDADGGEDSMNPTGRARPSTVLECSRCCISALSLLVVVDV